MIRYLKTSRRCPPGKRKAAGKQYSSVPLVIATAIIINSPKPFPTFILPFINIVNDTFFPTNFNAINTVLVSKYDDALSSLGWHADDEPELGIHPAIVSLSLGAPRQLAFRKKSTTIIHASTTLFHGDWLLMSGATQEKFHHSLLPSLTPAGLRFNLTFRWDRA